MTETLAPVARRNRVVALDALRGMALFGILLVNVQYFQGPERFLAGSATAAFAGADRVAAFLITALVEGKFITAFAFMFGVGVAIQTGRAEARGRSSGRLLARRLAVLAGFGAVHAIFVWSGDVLLLYAVLGFALLAFRRRPVRSVLVWAAAMYAFSALVLLLTGALAVTDPDLGTAGLTELADAGVRAYQSGSYPEMLAQRLRELGITWAGLPVIGPWTLAPMLGGMAAVRAGVVTDLGAHERLLRRVAAAGIGFGLPLSLLGAATGSLGDVLVIAVAPLLSAGYLALGARLFNRAPSSPLTRTAARVGRMALTNYLSQSILCTTVYYGLGWYGRGTLLAALVVTVAVWVFNVAFSTWWLARFEQGPAEWLWRALTYGPTARVS